MAFDLLGARTAGYSDEEIATYLGSERGFDVAGAVGSGYSYGEILPHLMGMDGEEEVTLLGQAYETVKAIPHGMASSLLTGAEGLAQMADTATDFVGLDGLIDSGEENEVIRLARQGQDVVNDAIGPDPAYADLWWTKAGGALGSMGSFFLPGGAVKLLGATSKAAQFIPTLGLATGVGAGEQAQRIQMAREAGIEVTPEAEDQAIAWASLIGVTEMLPIAHVLKGLPKEVIGQPFFKTFLPRLKSALGSGAIEGMQEVTAGFLQDVTEQQLYNENLPIGASAWDELTLGGFAGTIADLTINAMRGRRLVAMNKVERERETGVREERSAELKRMATEYQDMPEADIAGLLPYIPEETKDPNDPAGVIRTMADTVESNLGENFPLYTNFTAEQQTDEAGQSLPGTIVRDGNGEQYGPEFKTAEEAGMFASALNEKVTNRSLDQRVSLAIDQSGESYSPRQRLSLRTLGRMLFHPNENAYTPEQVNYAAGTTAENNYDHDTLTAQQAIEAGIKPKDMTAAQRINAGRLKKGLPETKLFSVPEAKAVVGDNIGKAAEFKHDTLAKNEDFRAGTVGGKAVVYSSMGETLTTRPVTSKEKAKNPDGPDRVAFKDAKDASNYASYLRSMRGKLIRSNELYGEQEVGTPEIESLLKAKNVSSDINSAEVRTIAEIATGVKARGKTKIADMSGADKRALYQKLRSLPKFEKPTKLPLYGLRPYSPGHYQAATQHLVEQAKSPELVLGEQGMPTREQIEKQAGTLSEAAYRRLTSDLAKDSGLQKRITEETDNQASRKRTETVLQARQAEELERIGTALKQAFSRFGLKNVGLTMTDYLRQAKRNPDGTVELGEENAAKTSEGSYNRAMNEIFIAVNAIKTNPRYKRDGSNLEELAAEALTHETLHAMRQADLFTQAEWETLENAARKHQKKDDRGRSYGSYTKWAAAAYSDLSAVGQMEEAIAEMTKDALFGRVKIGGRPKSLMRRIIEFMKGIAGIQDAVGYKTFDEIMQAVSTGEIATRAPAVRSKRDMERAAKTVPERGITPPLLASGVPVTSQGQATPATTPEAAPEDQAQSDFAGLGEPVTAESRRYPLADQGTWYSDADYEARGGRMTQMTPDEFLAVAAPLTIDEVSRDNIDDLKNMMQQGRGIDPLSLYPGEGVAASDGRHRAVAAKELGIATVPVIDFRVADDTIVQDGQLNEQQRLSLERKRATAEALIEDRTSSAEESGGRPDAGVRFERSAGTGRNGSLRVLATHAPNPIYQQTLEGVDVQSPTLDELAPSPESAAAFAEAIEASKGAKGGRKGSFGYGAAVYVYTEEQYAGMRLFLSKDRKYGMAIKPDGDIVSVFSDGGGKAYPMLALATEQGGTKLDAFDTILPKMYRVAGFREVGRDKWDEYHRPPGWDKKVFRLYNNGEPDVVYMEYDATYNPYEEGDTAFSRRLPTTIADKLLTDAQRGLTNFQYHDPDTGEYIQNETPNTVLLTDAAQKFFDARGGVVLDLNDPATSDLLSQLIAAEAEIALTRNADAVGWYDEHLTMAKRLLGILHPEVQKGTATYDPVAEHALDYATAVTSNGLGVIQNYKHANEQYEYWADHGYFMKKGWGKQGDAMLGAFGFYNAMKRHGYDDAQIQEFLSRDFTVTELRQDPVIRELIAAGSVPPGIISGDEAAATAVKGSYVMGAKIGQGFYQNLRGNYDALTMDRWWMRMFNRLTGNPFHVVSNELLQKNAANVRKLVKAAEKRGNRYMKATIESAKEDMGFDNDTDQSILQLAGAIDRIFQRDYNRASRNKTKHPFKAPLFNATEAARKNYEGSLEDVPRHGRDRQMMRESAQKASQIIQQELGVPLTTADLQALMWYAEKGLFRANGTRTARGDDNDYADGAIALLRERRIPDAEIQATLPATDGYRLIADENERRAARQVRQGAREIYRPAEESTRSGTAQEEDVTVYSRRGKVARYTPDRVQNLFSEYAYPNGRVIAAVVEIDPGQFVAATTPTIGKEMLLAGVTPLDVESLSGETQTPFVEIEHRPDGIHIVGHEGRHRLQAMSDAGVTSAPLIVMSRNVPYDNPSMGLPQSGELEAQSYDYGGMGKSEANLPFKNPVDITYDNRPEMIDRYGDKPQTVTPKRTQREHDPSLVADAVALNKSAADQAGPLAITQFSTRASPAAQYIAQRPEAGHQPDPEVIAYMRRVPEVSESDQNLLDSFISTPPVGTHPYKAYNMTMGAMDNPSWVRQKLTKFKQEALNRYARLEHLNWSTDLRENLADTSSIAAALHADRALGIVAATIKYGTPHYESGVMHVKSEEEGGGKSLIKVMSQLYSPEHGNLIKWAQAYAMSQRSHRLDNEGKKVPVSAAKRAEVERAIAQFVDPETGENIIKRWHKDWQDFNNAVITMMEKSGVLTDETAQIWREASDYYPFYRVAEGGGKYFHQGQKVFGGMTGAVSLKELKGSEAPINMDMMEAISLNLSAAVQMSMKNIAQQRIVRDLVQLGLAEEVGIGQTSSAPVSELRINGKQRRFAIYDPLVYESMLPMEGTELISMVRNTFGLPATALRELVTRSPGFMMVNLLRDSLSSYGTSGASLIPIYSTLKGLLGGVERLEKMGVVGGYDYANDPEDVVKFWGKELKKSGVDTDGSMTAPNLFMRMWNALGQATTASDAATRNAVFDDVFAKTNNLAEASFQAMEVINFGRRGRHPMARMLGSVIPFLNARFQGVDVFFRAYTGNYTADKSKNRSQVAISAAVRASILMGATALYYMMASDDDQYKMASDVSRDMNWIIPTPWGVPVTIPIPFEVGLFFKVIPETILAATIGDKTNAEVRDTVKRSITSTLEVSPFSIQFMGPILEASINYNAFNGRQIVPQYMMDWEAGLQSDERSTELAKALGETMNWSPKKIDHAFNGYIGTMGGYAYDLIDSVLRSEFLQGDNKSVLPARPWYDYPVIRRLTGQLQDKGLMQDAYDLSAAVNTAYLSLNQLMKAGRMEEAQAYIRNRQTLLSLRGPANAIDKALAQVRAHRRLIMTSDMPADLKKREIEQLDAQINALLHDIIPKLKAQSEMPFFERTYYSE